MPVRPSVVAVVPARDEEALVGACVRLWLTRQAVRPRLRDLARTVAALDGRTLLRRDATASVVEPEDLGIAVAEALLADGAATAPDDATPLEVVAAVPEVRAAADCLLVLLGRALAQSDRPH